MNKTREKKNDPIIHLDIFTLLFPLPIVTGISENRDAKAIHGHGYRMCFKAAYGGRTFSYL